MLPDLIKIRSFKMNQLQHETSEALCIFRIRENLITSPKYVHEKVKVKLSLCLTKHYAMNTYWMSGGIAPRILDLGTRWR
jgi:hypothetical protein